MSCETTSTSLTRKTTCPRITSYNVCYTKLLRPAIDPLKANIAQFRAAFNLFIVLMVAFMLYVHGLSLAWNLGYTGFRMSGALLPAIGSYNFV